MSKSLIVSGATPCHTECTFFSSQRSFISIPGLAAVSFGGSFASGVGSFARTGASPLVPTDAGFAALDVGLDAPLLDDLGLLRELPAFGALKQLDGLLSVGASFSSAAKIFSTSPCCISGSPAVGGANPIVLIGDSVVIPQACRSFFEVAAAHPRQGGGDSVRGRRMQRCRLLRGAADVRR